MKITCDQVDWMHQSLSRYIDAHEKPAISRAGVMKVYACMYELIEILGLEFEDDLALHNATPPDVRKKMDTTPIGSGPANKSIDVFYSKSND